MRRFFKVLANVKTGPELPKLEITYTEAIVLHGAISTYVHFVESVIHSEQDREVLTEMASVLGRAIEIRNRLLEFLAKDGLTV